MFVIRDGAKTQFALYPHCRAEQKATGRRCTNRPSGTSSWPIHWFRTLSGLDYASGFSAERILHEYKWL